MDRITKGMSKAGHDPNRTMVKRDSMMTRMIQTCKHMAAGIMALVRGRQRAVR